MPWTYDPRSLGSVIPFSSLCTLPACKPRARQHRPQHTLLTDAPRWPIRNRAHHHSRRDAAEQATEPTKPGHPPEGAAPHRSGRARTAPPQSGFGARLHRRGASGSGRRRSGGPIDRGPPSEERAAPRGGRRTLEVSGPRIDRGLPTVPLRLDTGTTKTTILRSCDTTVFEGFNSPRVADS